MRTLTATEKDTIARINFMTQELILTAVNKETKYRNEQKDPLKFERTHLANCIIENREPEITGLDECRVLQMYDVTFSARTGNVIKIKF